MFRFDLECDDDGKHGGAPLSSACFKLYVNVYIKQLQIFSTLEEQVRLAYTLNIAVQGAGYFAQFHHDAWRRLEACNLVAICDRDPAKSPDYQDLKALLAAEKIDVLDIATPPETHADAIKLGLKHKLRAIVCQKPFCRNLEEATAMVALAEKAGIPLIVHENFRFQPWMRFLRDQIDQGRIGAVHQASFRLRPGDGRGPRAYLDRQPYFQKMPRFLIHETGVHFIDVYRYLLGDPVAVYADLRRLNPAILGEDAGFFILDFEGGTRALFDANRLIDHAAENHRLTMGEMLVEGTDGALELFGDGSVRFRARGEIPDECVFEPRDWPGFAGDCVGNLCAHVRDAVLRARPVENTGKDYLEVLKIEEAIYRSDAEGTKIVL